MEPSKKYQYVYSYETKKGKKWMYRFRYYDHLHERQEVAKRGFLTEKEAYKELLEVQIKIETGGIQEIQDSRMTVKQWFGAWYDTYKDEWEVSTKLQRKNFIKYQVNPLLGKYQLQKLNVSTYKKAFIQPLLKKYKPATVDLFHSLFMIGVNAAVKNRSLDENRLTGITLPRSERSNNVINAAQLDQLLTSTKEKDNITNYTLLLTLAYSGMRIGEALGLTVEDVDFDANTLSVKRTRDGKGVRKPKTDNSYRTIKMEPHVMMQLKEYVNWLDLLKRQFGDTLSKEDFLFCSYQTGKPLGATTIFYVMKRACQQAGLDKTISAHGLRHTHATLLLQAGAPVISVAKRLGNTPAMIMNIYGHVLDEMEDELVYSFSEKMGLFDGFGELSGEHSEKESEKTTHDKD